MKHLVQNTRVVATSTTEENSPIFVIATTITTLWGC
jgi:hypothetical protein